MVLILIQCFVVNLNDDNILPAGIPTVSSRTSGWNEDFGLNTGVFDSRQVFLESLH
jgi:hypothetical protein